MVKFWLLMAVLPLDSFMDEEKIFERKKDDRPLLHYVFDYLAKNATADEKLLEVQRQHFIVILFKLAFIIFLSIAIALAVILILQHKDSSYLNFIPFLSPRLYVGMCLILLSVSSTIGTYTFMRWYYQFYIITTKRVIHVHFFRIKGFYQEEIFFEKVTEKEIDRSAPNILYDLLGIEDVYMYMATFERAEPFIFRTPQNAQKIEDILENLALTTGGKRR